MPETTPRTSRSQSIDVLRGIAVALVVGFHFWPGVLPWGYVGVDIFFLLAGYFAGERLIRPDMTAWAFMSARLWRIIPALAVMLSCYLLVGALAFPPDTLSWLALNSARSVLFLSDLFPGNADYFGANALYQDVPHLWSVSFELKAFLLIAGLFLLPVGWRLPIILALAAVSIAAPLFGDFPYQHPYPRFWQIACGVLLGARTPGAVWAALAALFFNLAFSGGGGPVLIPALIAMAIIILLLPLATPGVPDLLRPIAALGRISYGVFLWHWPVMRLSAMAWGSDPPLWVMTGVIAATLVLGWLSYQLIERPCSGQVPHLHMPWLAPIIIATPIALCVWLLPGLPGRLPGGDDLWSNPIEHLLKPCNNSAARVQGSSACLYGAEPKIALIGDSHAVALAAGLEAAGLSFEDHSLNGCPFILRAAPKEAPECIALREAAIASIESNPAIETVIMSARWGRMLQPAITNQGYQDLQAPPVMIRAGRTIDATKLDALYQEDLAAIIERLAAEDRQVIVLGQTPMFGWNPRDRAFGQELPLNLLQVPEQAEISVEAMRADSARVMGWLEGLPVRILDPLELLCDGLICPAWDRHWIVADSNHLSVEAATELVRRQILPAMRAATAP